MNEIALILAIAAIVVGVICLGKIRELTRELNKLRDSLPNNRG